MGWVAPAIPTLAQQTDAHMMARIIRAAERAAHMQIVPVRPGEFYTVLLEEERPVEHQNSIPCLAETGAGVAATRWLFTHTKLSASKSSANLQSSRSCAHGALRT